MLQRFQEPSYRTFSATTNPHTTNEITEAVTTARIVRDLSREIRPTAPEGALLVPSMSTPV
jgi:hypothetical protein